MALLSNSESVEQSYIAHVNAIQRQGCEEIDRRGSDEDKKVLSRVWFTSLSLTDRSDESI